MSAIMTPVMPKDVFDCLQEKDAHEKSYQIWVDGSFLD